jgi:hypothetical protein
MSSLPDNNGAAASDACPDVVHGKFQGVCKKPSTSSSSSSSSSVELSVGLIVGIAAAGAVLLGGAAYYVFTSMNSGTKAPEISGRDGVEFKQRGAEI